VNPFPTGVKDIKLAIRKIKQYLSSKTIPNYTIDISPAVGMGHSAGGHLIGLVGVSEGVAALEPSVPSELQAYSSKLDGVINVAGPLDLMSYLTANRHLKLGTCDGAGTACQLCIWNPNTQSEDCSTITSPQAGKECNDGANCIANVAHVSNFLQCKLPFSPSTYSALPACYTGNGPNYTFHPNVIAASASTYVDATDPPIYVYHSTADGLVQPTSSCSVGAAYVNFNRTHEFWVDISEDGKPVAQGITFAWLWAGAHIGWRANATAINQFLSAVEASPGNFPDPETPMQPTASNICIPDW
jgi:hypothetical protein